MFPLNFVIIGAPKTGTSSLFNWLDAHPALQGSTPKETFFFMDAEHPLCARHGAGYTRDGLLAYERFFPERAEECLRFEATTHYYYQKVALSVFSAAKPQPLVVVVLRNPSDRIYSSFRFTQENLAVIDRRLSFDRYIDCLLSGDVSPAARYYTSRSSFYVACRELELSRYINWLKKWAALLEIGKLEIVLFEELKAEPKRLMMRLCGRLQIDPNFYEDYDFLHRNRTMIVRSQKAHRLARRLGSRLPLGAAKHLLKRVYSAHQLGASSQIPTDADCEALRRLDIIFAASNLELSAKFGLNLTLWSVRN